MTWLKVLASLGHQLSTHMHLCICKNSPWHAKLRWEYALALKGCRGRYIAGFQVHSGGVQ